MAPGRPKAGTTGGWFGGGLPPSEWSCVADLVFAPTLACRGAVGPERWRPVVLAQHRLSCTFPPLSRRGPPIGLLRGRAYS